MSTSSRTIRTVSATGLVLLASAALTGCSLIGGLFGGGNVFSLSVGDCFDAPSGESEEVSDVPMKDCAEPHDYEVSKSVIMDQSSYPGTEATLAQADAACITAFEEYTGRSYVEPGNLDFDYFYPTPDSWDAGDREILCLVFDWDEKIVGSVKNIGPVS